MKHNKYHCQVGNNHRYIYIFVLPAEHMSSCNTPRCKSFISTNKKGINGKIMYNIDKVLTA